MAKKKLLAAAAIATVAAAGVGSAASAMASGTTAPPATSTSGGSTSSGDQGPQGPGHGHGHTAVSGTEAENVKKAVAAKYTGVTVERVVKDADGSYDVLGTKAGERVGYEVSKDLATVTERTGGPRGMDDRGRHGHTAVTGTEAENVKKAVAAKYTGVTVEHVVKDADGSYDVLGTKAGERVGYEVSKDLATVTERTGGPRGMGERGMGEHAPGSQNNGSGSSSASPSGTGTV